MGKRNKNKGDNTENNDVTDETEGTDDEETSTEGEGDMLTLDPSEGRTMETLTSPEGVMGTQAEEQTDDAKKDEGAKADEAGTELPTLDTPGASTEAEPSTSEGDSSTGSPVADEEKPLEALAPEAPSVATDEAVKGADEEVKSEAGADEDKEPEAELSEVHEEAQPVVDAAPAPLEELKQAANIAGPALKRLGDFSEAIEKLEDEARARFDYARQKMTEAVAALENIYKRG